MLSTRLLPSLRKGARHFSACSSAQKRVVEFGQDVWSKSAWKKGAAGVAVLATLCGIGTALSHGPAVLAWVQTCQALAPREDPVSNIVTAFEDGRVHMPPNPPSVKVERSDLAKLQQLIFPVKAIDTYGIVTGMGGVGKTTAVLDVIRKVPETFKQVSGVVAFSISDAKHFCKDLAKFLGCNLANSTDLEEEWGSLAASLQEAAIRFNKKHGRPMVLVLDNVQNIHKRSPEFLTILQRFAKDNADKKRLRVVFVSSENAAVEHMLKNSERSRATHVFVYGISTEAATQFLVDKHGWKSADQKAAAAFIAEKITGGNFALLNQVESDCDSVKKAELFLDHMRTDAAALLVDAKFPPAGGPVYRRMVEQKRIHKTELGGLGVSGESVKALVAINILQALPGGDYSCAAPFVAGLFDSMKDGPVNKVSK